MRQKKMTTEMENEGNHNCYSEPQEDRVDGLGMAVRE